jgi:hypothetical protein
MYPHAPLGVTEASLAPRHPAQEVGVSCELALNIARR